MQKILVMQRGSGNACFEISHYKIAIKFDITLIIHIFFFNRKSMICLQQKMKQYMKKINLSKRPQVDLYYYQISIIIEFLFDFIFY